MKLLRSALCAAVAAVLLVPAHALAAPVFVLTGKGFGHGIGMSQYGAQGFAQHGWLHDAILTHYYTGTTVATGYPNVPVKVLVASAAPSLPIGSSAAFTVEGQSLAAGTYTVQPGSGQVTLSGNGVSQTFASPATFVPGSAPLSLAGVLYRGTIGVASTSSTKLAAVNTVGREDYVRGVVPREMPASWEPEALETQAVAARTYALATGGHCTWQGASVFCAGTSDQVYGGQSAETAATNAAVAATAGEVVTYQGSPAATYFSSTSGGRTADKAEEWGPPAVAYLVSVDDPYDSISPHHAWGPLDAEVDCPGTATDCVFTAAQVQTALGLASAPTDLEVTARNSDGRVGTLTATAGGMTAVTGGAARTALGLRSTWFFVGVLSTTSSASTVTYGTPVDLSGLARSGGTAGWSSAMLQRRRFGETAWTTIGATLPNGAWTDTVTPIVRTDYRVVSGNATGSARRLFVRTRVAFSPPVSPFTTLKGAVGPARSGIVVTLERRRTDGTWAFRGTKTTASNGSFSFTVSQTGTYRARADAGDGFLEGSTTVTTP